jgi:hypothetical protein
MMLAGCLRDGQQADYRKYYSQSRTVNLTPEIRLLDNGAWEAESVSGNSLVDLAERYHATEVIAPDVLDNPVITLEMVDLFLSLYQTKRLAFYQGRRAVPPPVIRIAAVAHGKTVEEARAFVTNIAAMAVVRPDTRVSTIAIGRAFSRTVGDTMARYDLASWTKNEFGPAFDIHLLGYNDDWPGELAACQGLVRSMDTAAPFTAALAGHDLLGSQGVPRPANFFQTTPYEYSTETRQLIEHNIEFLDELAGGPWRTNE